MATNIQFTPFAPGTTDTALTRISSVDPRLSRTHYFDGRLLKASDLTRDQVYLDERLLEAGQVLGSGIAAGLELTLEEDHLLRLKPGLAVAPSGRVLKLAGRTLEVNLQDSALISTLNEGRYRRWRRGLYAVVLQYAEDCTGAAEAYPQDLASQRTLHCNAFSEGVELALVPLRSPLPQSDALGARAGLVRELIGDGGTLQDLPDEAVPLGLLAMDSARPLWLDLGLVRRPLRPLGAPDALQQDLAAHYEELLAAVLDLRRGSGLAGGFAASQHFRLLPPFGRLPKEALDPEHGGQTWFPEGYEVTIAPLRRSDLAAVLRESAPLAPMDLERDQDADVMVLVPMSDQAFAWRARQLERGVLAARDALGQGRLLAIDHLALRLYPAAKPHVVDTDADVWRAIWADAAADEVLFVRRPPRTAETGVAALVLARGFELPEPTQAVPVDAADLEEQLDEALEGIETLKSRVVELEAGETSERIAALEQEVENLSGQLAAAQADDAADAQILASAQEQIQLLNETVTALEAERDAALAAQAAAVAGRDAAIAARAAALVENAALADELKAAREKLAQAGGGGAAGPDIADIARLRRLEDRPLDAAGRLAEALKDLPDARAAVAGIALMVERRYDAALWPSLLTLAKRPQTLTKLRDTLADKIGPDLSAAAIFVEIGPDLKLTAAQITQWKELAG